MRWLIEDITPTPQQTQLYSRLHNNYRRARKLYAHQFEIYRRPISLQFHFIQHKYTLY